MVLLGGFDPDLGGTKQAKQVALDAFPRQLEVMGINLDAHAVAPAKAGGNGTGAGADRPK